MLKRWFIARSLIVLESRIPNEALVVFFNTMAKEFIGVPLANFNFCNFICRLLLYSSPQNLCSNLSFTWAYVMLAFCWLFLNYTSGKKQSILNNKTKYLAFYHFQSQPFFCMLLSCHVRVSEWIYSLQWFSVVVERLFTNWVVVGSNPVAVT